MSTNSWRRSAAAATVVGPTVAQGAIVYGELRSTADLPAGWTDEQDGDHYRLRRRDDDAPFGCAVGPHSWKRFQLPPEVTLWRARLGSDGSLATWFDQFGTSGCVGCGRCIT